MASEFGGHELEKNFVLTITELDADNSCSLSQHCEFQE